MNNVFDYKRYAILYVDDEEKSLKYFTRAFSDEFRIFTANNATDGYRLLEDHQDEIAVIISDQRMPGEKGVQFLEKARRLRPRTIRILATAFSDLEAAIDAVNAGAIYKYVTKPWDPPDLMITLRRSIEFFMVQVERDLLLREKLSVLHKMVITDRVLSLGVLAAGLGHHVRNSMTAVRTFLELTPEMLHRENLDLEQLRHPAFWQDFHRTVQSRVKLILDLLDDLKEDTNTSTFRFDSEVHLRALIQEALDQASEELTRRQIQVVNAVPESLPSLLVDAKKIRKLFALIVHEELSNLQDGAIIRFEANPLIGTDGQVQEIEVFINDNGPGMPNADMLSLFDPFLIRTDQPQEFGVYLMACYLIVHHHGGRMNVQPGAGPEKGLTYQITLPLKPASSGDDNDSEHFLVRAMTNEKLWERLMATA